MKRIFLLALITAAPLLWSCSDDELPSKVETAVLGYTALTPDSSWDREVVRFFFFNIQDISLLDVSTESFSGTAYQYPPASDETFRLLRDEGKLKLKTGVTVSAFKTLMSNRSNTTFNDKAYFDRGKKYVVAAIYSGSTYGYKVLYSNKYAVRNLEIGPQIMFEVISVGFPCDLARFGLVPWVSSGEQFGYDFSFN